MYRLIRVPLALAKSFRAMERHFHWNHCSSFRLRVVAIAWMWEWRHMATLYWHLEGEHHRTRFNTFCLVERWHRAAALRDKPPKLLSTLQQQPGDIFYVMTDDAKEAKWGS
jgi:hypothetical protein